MRDEVRGALLGLAEVQLTLNPSPLIELSDWNHSVTWFKVVLIALPLLGSVVPQYCPIRREDVVAPSYSWRLSKPQVE